MPDDRPPPSLANKSSHKEGGLYEWESLGPLATDNDDWKTTKLQDIYVSSFDISCCLFYIIQQLIHVSTHQMRVKWRGTDEHTWEPIVNLVQDGNFTQVRDVIFRDLPESTRLGLWHRFQSKNEPPNLVSLFGGKRVGKGAAGPSSLSKVPKPHSPSTEGRSQMLAPRFCVGSGGKPSNKSPLDHLASAAVGDADATDSDHSESVSNVGSASKRGSKKRAKTGAPSINLRYEEIDQVFLIFSFVCFEIISQYQLRRHGSSSSSRSAITSPASAAAIRST